MRPKSRGKIQLNSSDPHEPPLIYPNYFSHPDDLKVLIEGAKIGFELSQTPSMQELNATMNERGIPECMEKEFRSDEYWKCQVTHFTCVGQSQVSFRD